MKTLLIVVLAGLSLLGVVRSAEDAFDCYRCSGKECLQNPAKQSCEDGSYCYKMEVRYNFDVDNPHIVKGCTKSNDETFWKWSCFEDCKENQEVGADKARVCIYCCDTEYCNSAVRTTSTVYGVLIAIATLVFTQFL